MMNENALTAFLALAETGSFQSAARTMGVSNASLSRYIGQAEDHTGLVLFHRSRNSSTLTRAGQEFLPIAEALREDLNRYASRVAGLRDTGPGTLLIGCGPLTTRTLILPVLRAVRHEMPDLRFRILVSAYARPLDLLQAGDFDVFLGDLTYTPEAEDVEIMVMEKQQIQFVAHRDHEIHQSGPQTMAGIFEYPFASPHLHKHWKATLITSLGGGAEAVEKVNAQPHIECDDYNCLTGLLVEPDYVVGGMPETFTELIRANTVKPVSMKQTLEWNICAARKSQNTSAAVEFFWNELAKYRA
ncbi:LysR family transcriptional regulator [Tropicibacter sp. R16_0]|uniref:LysR substrate-binding domain-containing protein n=1 Tax=Tropicibacter sp. R16_0 TaxID=2821102 RepID=UPI001AD9C464|nr:LysR family transcriptional regulator [Tropicibacter sp. R16_0]MBO9450080.1 LysR family transcriptional regulator [Tropicibacter sp. R16_0]